MKNNIPPSERLAVTLRYLASFAAPSCLRLSVVMLISVPAKISYARPSFPGLTTSHHFLGLEYPRGEPASLNSSHYCLASSIGPAPVASSANQHCFAVLQL